MGKRSCPRPCRIYGLSPQALMLRHPTDCPAFEYKNVSGYQATLQARTEQVLKLLRRQTPKQLIACCSDTRGVHRTYFEGLIPAGHPYFAGHYRGENFKCLLYLNVSVRGDPRVGHPAFAVPLMMDTFASDLKKMIHDLDNTLQAS